MQTKPENDTTVEQRTAADWLVLLDAGDVDSATRGAFLAWLRSRPENEADFEICEAVLAITVNLARDNALESGFDRRGEPGGSLALRAYCRTAMHWVMRPGLPTALAILAIAAVVLGPLNLIGTAPSDSRNLAPGQAGDTPAGAAGQVGDTPAQTGDDPAALQVELPQQPPAAEGDDEAVQAAQEQSGDSACVAPQAREAQIRNLEQQIREVGIQLEELRVTFTNRHPQVASLMRTLDLLEVQLTELREEAPQSLSIEELLVCMREGRAAPDDAVLQ